MGPGWVHFFLLVDTGLSKVQLLLVDAGEWAEDVLLNHLHRLIHVVNDYADDNFLVSQHHL